MSDPASFERIARSGALESDEPRFAEEEDPFVIRIPVTPLVWLPPERAIPIHAPEVWTRLSFTREADASTALWTGQLRSSLNAMREDDAKFLEQLLVKQAERPREYPLTDRDHRRLRVMSVRRADGDVGVTVPGPDSEEPASAEDERQPAELSAVRESIRIQALLARIGMTMGFKIWVPTADRSRVLDAEPTIAPALLPRLPMNYDETTLQTIQNIDLIWIDRRSMRRAFEIEHTTAIYSGLLRMADLLALQPNMDIRAHRAFG